MPEFEIFVVLEADAAQDDHIGVGAHADAGQKIVIGLARRGKDRQFLAFHQGVENIHHGNARLNKSPGNDAPDGIDRRAADFNFRQSRQVGPVVDRFAGTVEYSAQEGVAEGHAHGASQETDLIARGYAPGPGKYL